MLASTLWCSRFLAASSQCLDEQDPQIAIATLRYLTEDRAIRGRDLLGDEPQRSGTANWESSKPEYIGRAISSGCIRMTNEDVIDLYNRVKVGTIVVVLPSGRWTFRPYVADGPNA